MFDFGFLTLPFIAAAAVFGLALFTGEEISISKIAVPTYLEAKGLNDVILTRRLTDEIRELSLIAGSELEPVDVDGSSLDKSVGELESYFQLEQLFTGVRDLFGLVPFYVSGELTGEPADLTMTLRVFYKEEDRPSDVIQVSGTVDGLHEITHDAALQALEHVNPYVVALYWRRSRAGRGQLRLSPNAGGDRPLSGEPAGRGALPRLWPAWQDVHAQGGTADGDHVRGAAGRL